MFIRVKSKATGHEFDIHEHKFDEAKHRRVDQRRYPPVSRPRKTKFRLPHKGASFISPAKPVEEVEDVADDS